MGMTRGSATFPPPITELTIGDGVITAVARGAYRGTGVIADESPTLAEVASVGGDKLIATIPAKVTNTL